MTTPVHLKASEWHYRLNVLPCFPCNYELETIAEKKIQGIAMNTLEKLVHWIASWFRSYRNLITSKQTRIASFGMGIAYINDVVDRRHPLLFDCTSHRIADTKSIPLPNGNQFRSYLTLIGRKVFFNADLNLHRIFNSETTREVIVEDFGVSSFKIIIRPPEQDGLVPPEDTYTVNLVRDLVRNANIPNGFVPNGFVPEDIYVARPLHHVVPQAPQPERLEP